ncbi:coiled-coil domain-containing protein 124-like [Biomphalaria glabrata]|uniref:Coiled-coil domain-containing protein 124-like n=1 Tax=Biomphalaria glabrata TaxID=6526 RepID=A0A9W3BD90_BIOGL|nr:coiled-coil domain-containing protein 124-like [Biomphalaria glabrata]XP_055897384.1 coiled-coil domain-containing protein 124-like [Biomphalaria glabrata]
MPKKFKGENSKAAEAKARKDAAKQAETERAQKQEEDEFWKDDDKHAAKKQQRKEEREKKRQELLERKKTLQQLHEEEMSSIKGAKSQAAKLTRAQILENQERIAAAAQALKAQQERTHIEVPLEENVNIQAVEGDEARTVDEALSVLSVSEEQIDRHPEKRMRAAYNEYEESRLQILKQENPNLRLSQLKQMIKKEWMKAPENPLNQRLLAYNAKT